MLVDLSGVPQGTTDDLLAGKVVGPFELIRQLMKHIAAVARNVAQVKSMLPGVSLESLNMGIMIVEWRLRLPWRARSTPR